MRKILAFGLAVSFLFVGLAFAQMTKATEESCQALVKKAVEHYKTVGREQALKDFGAPSKMFVDGENYLSIYDMQGNCWAHGMIPSTGEPAHMWNLKDNHGKLFMQEFVQKADKPGATGWVEYYWTNPSTKQVQAKAAYFERVDDLIIQAGYYK
jgi:signal transduction histidine kinase